MDMICKAMHTENSEFYNIVKNEDEIKFALSDDELENETKLPYVSTDLLDEEEKALLGRYKHFKGNEYEALGIIFDMNNNKYVFYKALYENDIKFFIRPYDMFFEKVDKEKYPDVMQELRFEKID